MNQHVLPNMEFSAYVDSGRFPLPGRLRVLDRLARLQTERSRVSRAMERGQRVAARFVGHGTIGINRNMALEVPSWRTLESIRNSGTIGQLVPERRHRLNDHCRTDSDAGARVADSCNVPVRGSATMCSFVPRPAGTH